MEKPQRDESPQDFAVRAAEEKASQVGASLEEGLIIGCDTIVTLRGEIFGKPATPQHAVSMLRVLSGECHQVISGLALYSAHDRQMISGSSLTAVTFQILSEEEIAWYVDSGEPMDKAGAYGIQGLGMILIEKIEGSYTNVVGLPMELLKELLMKKGVNLLSLIERPP